MKKQKKLGHPLFVALKDFAIAPRRVEDLISKLNGIRAGIIEQGLVRPEEIVEPRRATVEDLALAHDLKYVDDVLNLRHSRRTLFSSFGLDKVSRDVSILNCGGTLIGMDLALEHGICMFLSGGTVYAFRDHTTSMSFFNDVAISLLRARARGLIGRAAIISSDAYHPEGMVSILSRFPEIFMVSIFDEDSRIFSTPVGEWDVTVSRETSSEEYLEIIRGMLPLVFDVAKPDVIVYLSSAKVQSEDPEDGTFAVTTEGLMERDEIVIGAVQERGIPILVLGAGGRTRSMEDYVQIHLNTARVVRKYAEKGWKRK